MSDPAPVPLFLEPSLQHYAWGDAVFIPRALGLAETGEPCAEAWFGAHARAPATAITAADAMPLDRLLREQGETILGAQASTRFAGLPYLLKILAARHPLSVQVHPDRAQAEVGFAREEAEGIPRDAPERSYRDPHHKPELLLALTPFEALCGFRSPAEIAADLPRLPEVAELVPGFEPTAAGVRALLEHYFALSPERVEDALSRAAERLRGEARTGEPGTPEQLLLELHASFGADRGVLFAFLLERVHLEPGEAIFLPAGVPHAYLRGAAVELMASSDNVLRAGLTSKHVDPRELLAIVRCDASAPALVEVDEEGRFRIPVEEFGLTRRELAADRALEWTASGPETVLVLPGQTGGVTVATAAGTLLLHGGQACLLPCGVDVRITATEPVAVLHISVPAAEETLASLSPAELAEAVRRNLETTRGVLGTRLAPAVIGTVSGSAGAKAFWQRELDLLRESFGSRLALSFHEDLPVNQAFGLLLLWQRMRSELQPGEGALFAFVFGEGTRATPFTEAEAGQKPALRSFVAEGEAASRRWLSIVELAMRCFAGVESYLRRSGFEGLVVKWGDEVQIPTLDLAGTDPRLAGADVVRFVSMREITAADAANKDWVGVDVRGRVTAFIPRRPLAAMEELADRGWVLRRGDKLVGGVNLGSIALSRVLLDVLLEEFEAEVNDPTADRRGRPDLDPQLFTALTIAQLDAAERDDAWERACTDSPAMQKLASTMPDVLDRLVGVLERFAERHGRRVRMVALDFGDQYWGDCGQHRQMYELYTSLLADTAEGEIARALAGLEGEKDEHGNLILGDTVLGEGVTVRNSVLVDAHVERGTIDRSVLLGTHCGHLQAREAFDVLSSASLLLLEPRSGSYKVVTTDPVVAEEGMRVTSVFVDGAVQQLRVHESTDLRNEANYGAPLAGNLISFREAHEQAVARDPVELEAERARWRARVEAAIRGA